VSRLSIALAAYIVLGVLSWTTISDGRIRLVTWVILGMFAVKTLIRRNDVLRPGGDEGEEQKPM
jgi:hypothetical protein